MGCWAVVIEREQTNEKGLHALLEKLYMGDPNDSDIIPMHQSLFEGENRFGWLYEDAKYEKFSACFGSLIGGHSKRHFKDLLDAKTVKNKNSKLVGKDIKNKADKALKEGKIYLGYWNEFLGKDGKFPSGKTEDDALLHVLSRAQTTINLDQEEEEDDDDDEDNNSTSSEFTTPYMACFILFGPYSKKWGLDIVELFSVDTAAIDAKAKKLKAEKKKTIEIDMDETKDNRGLRAIDAMGMERQRIELGKVQTGIQIRNQETMELQQEFEMTREMYNMAEKQNDEEEMAIHYSAMKKIAKKRSVTSSNHSTSAMKRPKYITPTFVSSISSSSSSSSSSSQLAALRD